MNQIDILIIGAGAAGLSIAREIALNRNDLDIVVVEKEAGPGKGISSRSSEVIHAGIYYDNAFLKTRLCLEGAKLLYDYCEKSGVPFLKIGKLVVAVSQEEVPSIQKLYTQGILNGVEGLRLLDSTDIKSVEPNIKGIFALYSENTGIFDSHVFIKRLEAMSLNNSVNILYNTELTVIDPQSDGFICRVKGFPEEYCFRARIVINSAGLFSDRVAAMAGLDIDRLGYRIHMVKGEYFRLRNSKAAYLKGLVYPCPDKDVTGLGIHATKDLSGQVRFGPNAFYVEEMNYDVDPGHKDQFYSGISEILPFVGIDDIFPDTAGIRPKIQAKGEAARDFIIRHEVSESLYGFINLIGIESPGLTSCLSIGRYVYRILIDDCLL